jgi:ectoine hydroxylase-related dioxygenase (phytanoyl-CoA dioxygenase family)
MTSILAAVDEVNVDSVDAIAAQLRSPGWCVVPDVIPRDEVNALREDVVAEVRRQNEEWQSVARQIREAGQQAPPSGVGYAQAVINHVPRLGRYFADRRVLGAAESILGPCVRVSVTSGIVTHPGNERGHWHADWPYNQTLASHIPSPYPDFPMQISGIVMLSDFTEENGATFILPESHRRADNPTSYEVPRHAPLPDERQGVGRAGSMLFYDSRMWHAVAPNRSNAPRVAVTVRYSPWWINLESKREGSSDRARLVAATGGKDTCAPLVPRSVFESLDEEAKPLFAHWVAD